MKCFQQLRTISPLPKQVYSCLNFIQAQRKGCKEGEMTIIDGADFYTKRDSLKQIQIDGVKWLIYYLDEKTCEKWIEEYLHSELHGGGLPQLRKIDKFPWE